MSKTCFLTKGNLDLKAATTFGINVKPNSDNPIGYFGTGLKYAIAVLLRHGIKFSIITEGVEYVFYTKNTNFRDKTFQICRYKSKGLHMSSWLYKDLPFTTELGKNWELWQVFRELYSNTLDEAGSMYTVDDNFRPNEGYTAILIEGGPFDAVVEKRDEIFLNPSTKKLIAKTNDLEIYEGSSRYIYYRGLRAYDLRTWEKETLYTYNYLGKNAQLTEDRTIKYIWYVSDAIATAVAQSEDRKFIGSLIRTGDRYYEQNLDFNSVYSKSDTFNSVIYRMGSSSSISLGLMTPSSRSYFNDSLKPIVEKPKSGITEITDAAWDAVQKTYQELYDAETDTSVASGIHILYEALEETFNRKPAKSNDGDDIPF